MIFYLATYTYTRLNVEKDIDAISLSIDFHGNRLQIQKK